MPWRGDGRSGKILTPAPDLERPARPRLPQIAHFFSAAAGRVIAMLARHDEPWQSNAADIVAVRFALRRGDRSRRTRGVGRVPPCEPHRFDVPPVEPVAVPGTR